MDQSPLVSEQIDAGTKFLNEFDRYVPVTVAFWLKASEDSQSNLYVASDQINDTNIHQVYGEVLRAARKVQDPNFDVFQVKLIASKNPLARAALDVQQGFPGKMPIRLQHRIFGGISIDEAYIYPSTVPASGI